MPHRTPCAVHLCVALAGPDGVLCVVHRERGEKYRSEGPGATDLRGDCTWCNGKGDCTSCDAEGTHRCERSGCYNEHKCGACGGDGKCEACEGTGNRNGKAHVIARLNCEEREYLEWAQWTYLPPAEIVAWPWDGDDAA